MNGSCHDSWDLDDFGSATIKVTDTSDRFRNLLNNSKPSGIPFDPWA